MKLTLITAMITGLGIFFSASALAEDKATGAEIVQQCDNKYPGEDSRSQLSITLKDKSGNQRKTVYLRLWKDMKGEAQILDKMVLFTMFPPDAKGAAFMRWSYTEAAEKNADQWIYLPVLRKIRRVSVRDLADSFLGSDLTYGDITLRSADKDDHKLLGVEADRKGNKYWMVETTPKGPYQYSRWISWYTKSDDSDKCVKVRVDYYDPKGGFLKRQHLSWQRVNEAWVWDKVFVENRQTFHTSFFEVSKVKINGGIEDDWFTERRLRKGIN